jgi:hypothetical protein
MTIRFINSWGGYNDQDIADLSSADEGRLVSGGLAIPFNRSDNSSNVICNWVNGAITGFANAGESLKIDSDNKINNKSSAKVSFATAGATLVGTYTLTTPVYIGDNPVIQIPLMVSGIDVNNGFANSGSNDFQLWLTTASGQIRWPTPLRAVESLNIMRPSVASIFAEGTTFSSNGSFSAGATNTNFLNSQAVTAVTVVCVSTAAAANHNVWLGDISYGLKGKANITLCWDAQYLSQYTAVRQILNKYGLLANFALSTNLIGTGGRCTEAQLNEIYQDGHHFIHHSGNAKTSIGYGLASDWATSDLIADDFKLTQQYRAQRKWNRGIDYGVHAFNNARGTTDARNVIVISALKKAKIKAMRFIGVDLYGSIDVGLKDALDPYMMHCPKSLTATDTSASVISVIDRAEKWGKSAIITGHEVVPDSATPTGNQIKIGDLDLAMKYLRERIDAGGVTNLSIQDLHEQHYGAF